MDSSIRWSLTQMVIWKGEKKKTGRNMWGGIIEDREGNRVARFHRNIGSTLTVAAELWALRDGLQLAMSKNTSSLGVETDKNIKLSKILMIAGTKWRSFEWWCLSVSTIKPNLCAYSFSKFSSNILNESKSLQIFVDVSFLKIMDETRGLSFPWCLYEHNSFFPFQNHFFNQKKKKNKPTREGVRPN